MKTYKVLMQDYEKPFVMTIEAEAVARVRQDPDDKPYGDDLVFYVNGEEVAHLSGTPSYWMADAAVQVDLP